MNTQRNSLSRYIAAMLMLLLLTLPLAAQCEPKEMPYDSSLMPSYDLLTYAQQDVFDRAYDGIVAGKTEIRLSSGTLMSDVQTAMTCLLSDCPELCAVDPSYSVRYYDNTPDQASALLLEYTMPTYRQTELNSLAKQVVKGAPANRSDWEREKYLHDYLCKNVRYIMSAASPHSAWGALKEGKAVCEGYAKAMALLCRLSGIPCSVVVGKSTKDGQTVDHAWNIMRISGVWTLTDVTWDDQDMISYAYFNLTDRQMRADHSPDVFSRGFPACTDASLSYYDVTGSQLPSGKGMEQALFDHIRAMVTQGTMVDVRFGSASDYRTVTDDITAFLQRYNKRNADAPFYGSFSYICIDSQYCLTIMTD